MSDSDRRLREEREFHDRQAEIRRLHRTAETEARDEAHYLDHAPWIRRAIDLLAPLEGKRVLDLGCGHGWAALEMARQGASVVGTDLSLGYCTEARERHASRGQPTPFVQADGEALPFADGAFDRIWGNAILHHLDNDRALKEIGRLLAPGGKAVFCEPWGGNPLLALVRRAVPYPGKDRTRDESPWTNRQLSAWVRRFPGAKVESFELFSAARRFFGTGARWPLAESIDRALIGLIPPLGNWCRYRLLHIEKDRKNRNP